MDEENKRRLFTKPTPEQLSDPIFQMKRISRRSFIWATLAVGGTFETFHWLHQQPGAYGIITPLRKGLDFDAEVMSWLYSPNRISPTYTDAAITEARTNGIGFDEDFDPADWKLKLLGAKDPKLSLTIEDIKALPRHEFVAEFKCIEGWSYFMKWAGARFADFYQKFPPAERSDFVAMETPKGKFYYYVSLDMPSMMNPQTLLCYEMNGKPLELDHGAPLRLIIPHKYGVKNIKRIETITYSTTRPKDYWEVERGYDWYAGL